MSRAVLITGASSGIGAAVADRLAGTGDRLLLTARPSDRLTEAARRTGGTAIPADLASPAGCADLVRRAGDVDVLVANAGAGWAGRLEEMPAATLADLVALNLTAPMLLARALLPGMYARGRGALVFVTSIAGLLGVAEEAAYSATKAGLTTFAEALRHEAVPAGVTVSVVVPGVVDTPFFERRGRAYDRARPRPVPPQRVAAAVSAAIRTGRAETIVPGWLTVPARLKGAAPALYRRLAARQTS